MNFQVVFILVRTHVLPSPEYPATQAQLYDPGVLVHTALMSQLCEFEEHSSVSNILFKKKRLCVSDNFVSLLRSQHGVLFILSNF